MDTPTVAMNLWEFDGYPGTKHLDRYVLRLLREQNSDTGLRPGPMRAMIVRDTLPPSSDESRPIRT